MSKKQKIIRGDFRWVTVKSPNKDGVIYTEVEFVSNKNGRFRLLRKAKNE